MRLPEAGFFESCAATEAKETSRLSCQIKIGPEIGGLVVQPARLPDMTLLHLASSRVTMGANLAK
jgi:hypothetical protein